MYSDKAVFFLKNDGERMIGLIRVFNKFRHDNSKK